MTSGRALLSLVLLAAWPGLAKAEKWVGTIECSVLQGVGNKALHGYFEMHTDGSHLTYSRPVHVNDLAASSGVDEIGQGDWTGNTVTLTGGATGQGYSYTASYKGGMDNGRLVLVGEQIWQTRKIQEPHRDCRIVLHRAPP
jgi:hypothetical protein